MVGATLIGPIKDHFSWEITFAAFVAMIALAGLTLYVLNINQQLAQIAELDTAEVESGVVVY